MYKFIFSIILITIAYSYNLSAQGKYEKESRIKPKDVPAKALAFIDSLDFKNKVKWYKEEGFTGESIEAKFKYKKTKYSVEFDSLGNVEDIEVQVKWREIKSNIRDSILFQLKSACLKHKIVKVQRQFTGSESLLLSILKLDINKHSLTINYELIISCKMENNINLYEYLFNDSGNLISSTKIVFKNSSHLEY